MLSVAATIVFSLFDIGFGGWLLWSVEQMPRQLGARWHGLGAAARWSFAGLLMCGAASAAVMGIVALTIYCGRGLESAIEAGLCARVGTYTALAVYGVKRWGESRLTRRRPVRQSPASSHEAGGDKGA